MASATVKRPKRNGPASRPGKRKSKQACQSSQIRAMSSATPSSFKPAKSWTERLTFIGSACRIFAKPECISHDAARARALAAVCSGHKRAAGKSSATYSQMARLSHKDRPDSASKRAGTLPVGEYFSRFCFWASLPAPASVTRCSVKPAGPAATRSANQARRLQLLYDLLPTTMHKRSGEGAADDDGGTARAVRLSLPCPGSCRRRAQPPAKPSTPAASANDSIPKVPVPALSRPALRTGVVPCNAPACPPAS
mmetsp:Transcript_119977/g.373662  ORF Transcript_119977/g.373662 Transcript_119977/m.373662 type:complete len:253 (-) Transcript_119977:149-907(-)